jgi:hypothetical protein
MGSARPSFSPCWNDVAKMVFAPIGIKDTDSNPSNALSLAPVNIPLSAMALNSDAVGAGKGLYQPIVE